jgi:hypothetical protein
LPVYTNFIKALYNNIVGGLTKGTINCKVGIKDKDIEVDFINFDKKLKIKQIIDLFEEQAKEIKDKSTMAFMQEAMQLEIQEIEKAYQKLLLDKISQTEIEERLVSDKIEREINEILQNEENKEAIMSSLDGFFSTGFGVIEIKYCSKTGKFCFCAVERPEMCFFSPLARKKDKSDGGFCGRLRVVDRKYLQYEYDLTEKETKDLQNFPPIAIPSSMGLSGTPLQFFYGFGIGKEQEKNYIIVADCYYKDEETGKITKYVACGNKVLEEQSLPQFESFPLVFIDSSSADLRGQASIFSHCFAVQKDISWLMTKRAGLTMNIIGGKMLLPSIDEATKKSLESGWYYDKPFVIANVAAGNNEVIQPQIIPNTDLPQGLLAAIEMQLQTLRYLVNDVMANNQTTKNSDVVGVVSGRAMENANLNQNNLFNKYLNIVTSTLNKIFKKIIAPGLFHTMRVNEKGVEGYMFGLISKKLYDRIIDNIEIEVDIITDTSVVRDRNRQFLENIIGVLSGGQDPSYLPIFIKKLVDNSELSDKGDILNKIQEVEEQKASNPAPEDPKVAIEKGKLQLEQAKIQEEVQIEQQKLLLEQLKLEHDKEKHLRDTEVRLLDSELRHHLDVKNLDLNATKHAFEMINKTAEQETKNDTVI